MSAAAIPLIVAVTLTITAWLWAFAHKGQPGGNFPNPALAIYSGFALMITLAIWLVYFAAMYWGR